LNHSLAVLRGFAEFCQLTEFDDDRNYLTKIALWRSLSFLRRTRNRISQASLAASSLEIFNPRLINSQVALKTENYRPRAKRTLKALMNV